MEHGEYLYLYIETKSLDDFFFCSCILRDLNHANDSYDFFFHIQFYNVQGKSHIFIQLLRAHQNVYLLTLPYCRITIFFHDI